MTARTAAASSFSPTSGIVSIEIQLTTPFVYNGGTPKYVATINDVARNGYEGVEFSDGPEPAADAA